jgi:rhamnogalacturonyl hydrolase YesR
MALSGVERTAQAVFLLSWTLVFALLALPLSLLERAALRFLARLLGLDGPAVGRPALRALGFTLSATLLGGLLGLLARDLLLVVGVLGLAAPVSFALAGAALALILPQRFETRRRPGERLPLSSALAGALAALLLGGLFVASPEARYREKYAANRLTPEDLALPPPFPGRDPATLTDLEVARALALTYMRKHPPARLPWSWEEAVAVEGLLAYGRSSGDAMPLDYARAWVDAHAKEATTTPLYADSAAPALAVLALAEAGRARVESDAPIVARVDRYIRESAPRTRGGAISHAGEFLFGLAPRQAWIDSLFMHGVYLDRRAASGDSPWALEEASRLGRAVLGHLGPRPGAPARGLFAHALVEVGPLSLRFPVEEAYWARGNAWALAFLVDHARARAALGAPPDAALDALRERLFSEVLLPCEHANGRVRTDLSEDHLVFRETPENPAETCAGALVGWSLRREARLGLRPMAFQSLAAARAGARAVRAAIRWDAGHPSLTGTSIGTHPGFRAYYRAVPLEENVGHGVGAALLLLCEPEREGA